MVYGLRYRYATYALRALIAYDGRMLIYLSQVEELH